METLSFVSEIFNQLLFDWFKNDGVNIYLSLKVKVIVKSRKF